MWRMPAARAAAAKSTTMSKSTARNAGSEPAARQVVPRAETATSAAMVGTRAGQSAGGGPRPPAAEGGDGDVGGDGRDEGRPVGGRRHRLPADAAGGAAGERVDSLAAERRHLAADQAGGADEEDLAHERRIGRSATDVRCGAMNAR